MGFANEIDDFMAEFEEQNKEFQNKITQLKKQPEITGVLDHIRFSNPDNGYCVLSIEHKNPAVVITAVGHMATPQEGTKYKFKGKWTSHPKYGDQFKFDEFEIVMPTNKNGIAKYLESRIFGVGEVRSKEIVDVLGEDALDKIKADPGILKQFDFMSDYQIDQISEDLVQNEAQAEFTASICRRGVTPQLASRIWVTYIARNEAPDDILTKIEENPYILIDDIDRIGFITADKVAQALGIEKDSPFRIQAAVKHVLKEATNEGHVYLPFGKIYKRVSDLLDIVIEEMDIALLVKKMADDMDLLSREGNDVYLKALITAENQLADRVKMLLEADTNQNADENIADQMIEYERKLLKTEIGEDFEYAPEQLEALKKAMTNNVSIITGGPGTGKSTCLQSICNIYHRNMPENRIYLASPTGKAAKRMEETTGKAAMTIHRLLKYNPFIDGFEYGYDNPLPGPGLLVIDEGCFHWKTKVLLADGTKEYIGKIVNNKMEVEVMSYNQITGRLEPKKVKQWWKYERKSTLLEINVSRNNSTRRMRLIRCTPNHLILTENGWKKAGVLEEGERVFIKGRFFTELQKQIVLGCLLGDSHLNGLTKHRNKSYQIAFTQGDDQKEYLDFKINCFKGLFTTGPRKMKSGYGDKPVWAATMNLVDELDDLVSIVASNGKIMPTNEYLKMLTPLSLAIWYLDDGSLRINDCGSAYVSLHTERFDYKTNNMLKEYFEDLLEAKIAIQKQDEYYFLRFNKEGSRKFLDMVEPYIPSCMRYKHRNPEKANFQPTNKDTKMINAGPVPIKEIRKYNKKDGYTKYVYDIGVEGLHNYIAGNVVVHNSMCDVLLARDLFAAIEDLKVVLVGDVDQLPSVGPGSVLRDMINSNVVPTTRLKYNYRQANGSVVARMANEIAEGKIPAELKSEGDFEYIRVVDSDSAEREIIDLVKQLVADGKTAIDFQVLSPMRKSSSGVNNLNEKIRDIVNPKDEKKPELGQFRLGDKAMVIKNDYQKGVFNGNIGKVVSVYKNKLLLNLLDNDSPEPVEFKYEDLNILTLAYATTIHKAQGSEFPIVIMPLTSSHWIMLKRNLIYTGITRAKEKLILVADKRSVNQAVKNNLVEKRYSKLAEKLR